MLSAHSSFSRAQSSSPPCWTFAQAAEPCAVPMFVGLVRFSKFWGITSNAISDIQSSNGRLGKIQHMYLTFFHILLGPNKTVAFTTRRSHSPALITRFEWTKNKRPSPKVCNPQDAKAKNLPSTSHRQNIYESRSS